MDEFIRIITHYSCIKPTTQTAREAQLNGSLSTLEKKHPEVYARLTQLLFKDLLVPFEETDLSIKALKDYTRIQELRQYKTDDWCEMIMYNEMVEEFGHPGDTCLYPSFSSESNDDSY